MFSLKAICGLTSKVGLKSALTSSYATKSVFVGNIAWQTSPETLKEHFAQKINVHSVSLPLDSIGRTRGFGFIEIEEEDYDKTFAEFDGKEFSGRTLYIKPANNPKTPF